MAGRGRGRGRGRGMSFSIETLGFGRGEALPGPLLQPPPMFPPLAFRPMPLESGEEWDYLLALKQEFRGTMKDSPYYIKPSEKRRDIERYSDKYQSGQNDNGNSFQPDWSRLPAELKTKKRKRSKLKSAATPNIPSRSVVTLKPEEITKHLETLAKKEAEQQDEDEEEKDKEDKEKDEDEEEIDEDLYEEEELEEETDYNLNYFDNGEEMGDADDDLDDGPVYS